MLVQERRYVPYWQPYSTSFEWLGRIVFHQIETLSTQAARRTEGCSERDENAKKGPHDASLQEMCMWDPLTKIRLYQWSLGKAWDKWQVWLNNALSLSKEDCFTDAETTSASISCTGPVESKVTDSKPVPPQSRIAKRWAHPTCFHM